MPLRVKIKNFKSISDLTINLGDLTILIGPAASGKSNLLEALETIGYANKVLIESRLGEYPKGYPLAPFNEYVRTIRCLDLINRFAMSNSTRSEIVLQDTQENLNIVAEIECSQDPSSVIFNYKINKINGKFKAQLVARPGLGSLDGVVSDGLEALINVLAPFISIFQLAEPVKDKQDLEKLPKYAISPRLYGFDRMSVITNIMYKNTKKRYPYSYLEERATNIGWILYNNEKIVEEINDIFRDFDIRIEVEPLSDGQLAFKDYGKDVGPVSISDTVLRLLYMLTALLLSKEINYKSDGVRIAPLVMLEEPEAHIYPFVLSEIILALYETLTNNAPLLITTHSGSLAQRLWEEFSTKRDVRVYYVWREHVRGTLLYEIMLSDLLNEGSDIEDLILQPTEKIKEFIEMGILKPSG